jgi:hypothetical protein
MAIAWILELVRFGDGGGFLFVVFSVSYPTLFDMIVFL